jgi:hypothetical protein
MLVQVYLFVLTTAAIASYLAVARRGQLQDTDLLLAVYAAIAFALSGVASLNLEVVSNGTILTTEGYYLALLWLLCAFVNLLFTYGLLVGKLDLEAGEIVGGVFK